MSSLAAVGSGLDIPTIVSQLVAADRAPTENRINSQGTAATAKLSALGTIKSTLGNLQTALKSASESISTPAYKTTVAEGAGFTASSTSSASAGAYQLEVTQLATQHKLSSPGFAADSKVGAGTLAITVGDKTLDITVQADMGLSSLAREINRVADGKGVTASVITSDKGQHLVLTSTESGTAGQISILATPAVPEPGEDPDANRLMLLATPQSGDPAQDPDNPTRMVTVIEAVDAEVLIDGQKRTGSSNTFTDLVEGMTITLTKAEAGKTHALTVAADTSIVKTNLQAFVSTYNATLTTLKNSSNYNAETKQASALTGDSMVRGLQSQLRSIMGFNNVSDLKAIGITISKEGTLSFNSADFDKARVEQPSLAESLLGKEGRLSSSIDTLLKSNLDTEKGVLVQRTNTLDKQIKKLERELDDLDARMEKVRERYTKQFTAMDTLVAQMQNTSNYLTQQLANLPSSNKK